MDSYKGTQFASRQIDVEEHRNDWSFIMKRDVKALKGVDMKKLTIIFTEFKGLPRYSHETEAELKIEKHPIEEVINCLELTVGNLRYLNAEKYKIDLGDRFKEFANRIKDDIETKDTTSPFEIAAELKKVAIGVVDFATTQRNLRDLNGYGWCSIDSLEDDEDWTVEEEAIAEEMNIYPLNTVTNPQLLAPVLDEITDAEAQDDADNVKTMSMKLIKALKRYLDAAKEWINDRDSDIIEGEELPYGEIEKMKDLRGSVKLETELEHLSVEVEKIERLSKEVEAVNKKIEGIETEKLIVSPPAEPEQ